MKAGLRIAQTKGYSFQELERKLSVNMKTEPNNQNGYAWHPELKLSIQGFDTKKAADNLYRLARLLNEELYVRLYKNRLLNTRQLAGGYSTAFAVRRKDLKTLTVV